MASTSGTKRRRPSSSSSGPDSDDSGSSNCKSHRSASPLKRDQNKEAKLDIMTGCEETKRLLECPICFEFLLSPIYQCSSGHIICKTCKPKLVNCPSCETPIGDIRCLALDSILATVAFPCNHHHKGCNVFSKIQNLQMHIEECDYKPLKCHLHGLHDCDETSLYLVDTLRHLKDTHKMKTVEAKQGGYPNVFTSKNNIKWTADDDDDDVEDDGSSCDGGDTYYSELFRFDDKVFVALQLHRVAKSITYFGFYIIGSEEDASEYRVTITVEKTTYEDVVFKLEVTTRITSIRDFQAELGDPKFPHEAVIDRAALARDGNIPGQEDADWEVTYKVNKI